MKNSLATFAKLSIIICLLNGLAFADFREHFDLGQNYLSQYQYSGAITEFKSALRINYMDTSARIGLINSYLARGAEFANGKNWEKAANDYRSALFYLKYYPESALSSIGVRLFSVGKKAGGQGVRYLFTPLEGGRACGAV